MVPGSRAADGAAHGRQEAAGIGGGGCRQGHVAPGFLGQREIEIGLRGLADVAVFAVSGDADDLNVGGILSAKAQMAADDVNGAEEAPGEGLVDDDDAHGGGRIDGAEGAAAQHGDSHDVEVVVVDLVEPD